MKFPVSVFVVAVTLLGPARGAAPKQTITHEMALYAIMTFRVDPLSEDARQAAAVVMQFVDQSHDVLVRISPKTLPFLSNKSLRDVPRDAARGVCCGKCRFSIATASKKG
jgi:hypothetical protein